jgi:hypothetical protein
VNAKFLGTVGGGFERFPTARARLQPRPFRSPRSRELEWE